MPKFDSIVKAAIAFFGMTPGEMIAEWKTLTAQDKADIMGGLRAEGYEFPNKGTDFESLTPAVGYGA